MKITNKDEFIQSVLDELVDMPDSEFNGLTAVRCIKKTINCLIQEGYLELNEPKIYKGKLLITQEMAEDLMSEQRYQEIKKLAHFSTAYIACIDIEFQEGEGL